MQRDARVLENCFVLRIHRIIGSYTESGSVREAQLWFDYYYCLIGILINGIDTFYSGEYKKIPIIDLVKGNGE